MWFVNFGVSVHDPSESLRSYSSISDERYRESRVFLPSHMASARAWVPEKDNAAQTCSQLDPPSPDGMTCEHCTQYTDGTQPKEDKYKCVFKEGSCTTQQTVLLGDSNSGTTSTFTKHCGEVAFPGWRPAAANASDPTEWLQIDLGSVKQVGGVVIAGGEDETYPTSSPSEWVERFRVGFSSDGLEFTWKPCEYDLVGSASDCNLHYTNNCQEAASEASDVISQQDLLTPKYINFDWEQARYVRINPTAWNNWPTMRAAVLLGSEPSKTKCAWGPAMPTFWGFPTRGPNRLFDKNSDQTRSSLGGYAMAQQLPVTYTFELKTAETRAVDAFEWCTSSDTCDGSDPKEWVLEGSPDGKYWQKVLSNEDMATHGPGADWLSTTGEGREVCTGPITFSHTPAPTPAPTAPSAAAAAAQAVVEEAHVEEVMELSLLSAGIIDECKGLVSSASIPDSESLGQAFDTLPTAEKEAISDYVTPLVDSYAANVASTGNLAASDIEVTCVYLASDPTRTNLLNLDETCAVAGTVGLLESTRTMARWLLSEGSTSADDLKVSFVLKNTGLVSIGAGLVEGSDADDASSNALTMDQIVEAATSTLTQATSDPITVNGVVISTNSQPTIHAVTMGPSPAPTPAPTNPTPNPTPMPYVCMFSDWDDWLTSGIYHYENSCSQPCEGGKKKRVRMVKMTFNTTNDTVNEMNASNGDLVGVYTSRVPEEECPPEADLEEDFTLIHEFNDCNEQPCPVDCEHSEWTEWGACSTSCGLGTRTKTRTVTVEMAHGGEPCQGTEEAEDCDELPCPVDCVIDGWTPWTTCSQECAKEPGASEKTVVAALDFAEPVRFQKAENPQFVFVPARSAFESLSESFVKLGDGKCVAPSESVPGTMIVPRAYMKYQETPESCAALCESYFWCHAFQVKTSGQSTGLCAMFAAGDAWDPHQVEGLEVAGDAPRLPREVTHTKPNNQFECWKKRPASSAEMVPMGTGACTTNGYIAAGVTDYAGSLEECKAACLAESICAYLSFNEGVKCARYSDGGCKLSSDGYAGNFETFKKETGSGDVHFSVLVHEGADGPLEEQNVRIELEVALALPSVAEEEDELRQLVRECKQCHRCDWFGVDSEGHVNHPANSEWQCLMECNRKADCIYATWKHNKDTGEKSCDYGKTCDKFVAGPGWNGGPDQWTRYHKESLKVPVLSAWWDDVLPQVGAKELREAASPR
jgi:hypothetical protein